MDALGGVDPYGASKACCELTAEAFVPHPWSTEPGARLYRTGDLACFAVDGSLHYLGRLDHQVKLRGRRIELGEIEAQLRDEACIAEAVVVVREDRPGHPALVAYVVPTEMWRPEAVRQGLQERLPAYMIPSAFVPLAAFPLTPNGKLDRRALPAPDTSQEEKGSQLEEVRTPIEELLAGLWCEVLDRRQVGIDENFFELGGHSLLATRLVARMRAVLDVEVSLRLGVAPLVEPVPGEAHRPRLGLRARHPAW